MKKTFLLILLIILSTSFVQAQTVRPKSTNITQSDVREFPPPESNGSKKKFDDITFEKFTQIQLSMSYDQVREIIGAVGKETSRSKSGEYESVSYEWNGEKFSHISVRFQNGILVSKSQANLTDVNSTAELTSDKFRLIQIDMSYEVVSGILGSEGEISNVSKIGNSTLTSYIWKGPKNQRIFTSFKDNKLRNKTKAGLKANSFSLFSYESFTQIKFDMTYDEVIQILGSDGNETSNTKSGGYESKSYEWKGDNFARVSIRFQNGKLVSKSQSNLTERNGTADITKEKFNYVTTGMSYYEVREILGSDGEMSRSSKIGNATLTSYTWKGPNYQRVFATFKDDKLTNKTQSGLK